MDKPWIRLERIYWTFLGSDSIAKSSSVGFYRSYFHTVLCISAPFENLAFSQIQEKGPYIDQARFIQREDENLALEEVKSGTLDTYFSPIPAESANDKE